MKGLKNLYKTSPLFRAALRAALGGVSAYLAVALKQDGVDWQTLLYGAAGAAFFAVVGALTPIEPQVGVKTQVTK